MTARVLVVDDIQANVRLLEARLTAEYFDVLTAFNATDALAILARERVDVVLLDVMMPGMDGYECCQEIKANPKLQHIPVVMVTALDQATDKIRGLEAGADDFLHKPVDEIALVTRVKNLARLKMLNDEMMVRAASSKVGPGEPKVPDWRTAGLGGRVLVVDDHERTAQRIAEALSEHHKPEALTDPAATLKTLNEGNYDLLVISLSLKDQDGLRLCGQVRSQEKTRHLPIIVLSEPTEEARLHRALDMGVNDYLQRPLDRNEMQARVKTQVARKRHQDYLRNRLEETVEMAITDSLTGLNNRRFMEQHLSALLAKAVEAGRPLSLLVADIDFFKKVNDGYGHDAGDAVLREFALRLKRYIRGIDLACRLGGEEFVVIMPETDLRRAFQVAERLRVRVAADPFEISRGQFIDVTASVGIAAIQGRSDTIEDLFKRADNALYAAKRQGRNRVLAAAA
jgi:two-component system, cell cycle response regulator